MLRQIMRSKFRCRSSSRLRRRYLGIYILIIFFKRHPQTADHYRSVIGNREQFLVIGCQPESFSVCIKPASEYISGRKRISRLRRYLEFDLITVVYYKLVIVVNLFVIFH